MDTSIQNEPDSYENDFYSWTQVQAALLRDGRFDEADLGNIVEELESLGRAQSNALRSRYAVLCAHLLKSMAQPVRRSRSWDLVIVGQRVQIARLLEDNPGLKAKRDALFAQGYADARKLAAAETELPIETFPAIPTFTVEQAEDETWRP